MKSWRQEVLRRLISRVLYWSMISGRRRRATNPQAQKGQIAVHYVDARYHPLVRRGIDINTEKRVKLSSECEMGELITCVSGALLKLVAGSGVALGACLAVDEPTVVELCPPNDPFPAAFAALCRSCSSLRSALVSFGLGARSECSDFLSGTAVAASCSCWFMSECFEWHTGARGSLEVLRDWCNGK